MQMLQQKCWEIVDSTNPILPKVRQLYESTQALEEQIPWEWIERSIAQRNDEEKKKNDNQNEVITNSVKYWQRHLFTVTTANIDPFGVVPGRPERTEEAKPLGFAYGAYVPDWAGYLSYIGVDPQIRKRGVGQLLCNTLFPVLEQDAKRCGQELPFIIWESRRPIGSDRDKNSKGLDNYAVMDEGSDYSEDRYFETDRLDKIANQKSNEPEWQNWCSRMKLFQKIGAFWVDGIQFYAPNYMENENEQEAIPLQIFIKPIRANLEQFDANKLIQIVKELHEKVYRHSLNHPLCRKTMASVRRKPQLRLPMESIRGRTKVYQRL